MGHVPCAVDTSCIIRLLCAQECVFINWKNWEIEAAADKVVDW